MGVTFRDIYPEGTIMLLRLFASLVAFTFIAKASAQQTLDHPIGELSAYVHASGLAANHTGAPQLRLTHVVRVPEAGWLRLHFRDVVLEKGSYLRITSQADGETQLLDSANLALWGSTSAYFNGDAVLVELIADAETNANHFTIFQVERRFQGPHPRGSQGQCGICGDTDGRVPSSETWTGRLLPAGCTASVWNEDSCLVSAGHCIFGSMVMQFNVPPSQGNCGIVHPPIAEQFPVTASMSSNAGVGGDWAVMTSGTNNLGELPFERYGQLRPIAAAAPAVGQLLELTGYGVDQTCTRSQTQQFADGPITSVAGTSFNFEIDLRGGNSGSALVRNGEIVGIATHCPCPNFAMRTDAVAFVNARASLCGGFTQPVNDFCSDAIPFNGGGGDGVVPFSTMAATNDGPPNPSGVCNDGGLRQTGRDIWFTYEATCTGQLTVSTCGEVHGQSSPNYDSDLVVYGPYDSPAEIACDGRSLVAKRLGCNDDDLVNPCGVSQGASTVTVSAISGQTYLLRLGGKGDFDSGDGFLSVHCAPIAGACCMENGSCEVMTPSACADGLGAYQGDFTGCDPSPCAPQCKLLGDLNQDTLVRGDDIAGFLRAKSELPPEPGENPACADYGSGQIELDVEMFVSDLLGG